MVVGNYHTCCYPLLLSINDSNILFVIHWSQWSEVIEYLYAVHDCNQ